jgi:hypothetical protein
VDCDEAGIAGQLQVGFDEARTGFDRSTERRHGIFWRFAGGAAMRDYPNSHLTFP